MTGVVADGALWLAVPIALLAGIVSFLSPCVLPLVPGYLGFIGGAAAPRRVPAAVASATGGAAPQRAGTAVADRRDALPARGRLVLGVLLFIAGFTAVFIAVNMFGGTVGRFFLTYNVAITRVCGVIVILLGLVFVGVFGFAQRTLRMPVRGNMGLIGAPLLGVAMGVGWTPCIGPTLAVILSMSLDGGSAARGAVLGLAYSLGLGVPFLLIALGFGWATRSVSFLRRHIRTVNLIGGAVLIVLGALMVTGAWTAIMSQLQGVFAGVTSAL